MGTKSMFKCLAKITIVLFFVVCAGTMLSTDKAMAANANCPVSGIPPQTWGINTGSVTHGFASMTVHSTDAKKSGAELQNIGFTLHSQLPNTNTLPSGYTYGSTGGNDVNARIFQWGTEGPGSAGRWSSYRFATGNGNGKPGAGGATASSAMYVGSQIKKIGPEFHCPGWTELGPGVKVQKPDTNPNDPNNYVREDGNNFVLDCVENAVKQGAPNIPIPVHFWITNIDTPSVDSEYGGHWEVQVYNSDNKRIARTPNTKTQPMSFNNSFAVTNGLNMRVELIWHPNDPPQPQEGGTCNYFTTTGSKYVRKEVHIVGVSSGNAKLTSTTSGGTSTTTWTHGANFDEYVPAPVGQNVSPGTYQKEWWYRPTANTITVTVNTWSYNSGTNSWPKTTNTYTVSCYKAACSINWVDGDGPQNGYNPDGSPHYIVVAGGRMYVHGTFTQIATAQGPNYMAAGAYLDGPNGTNNLGFTPYAGYPHDFTLTLSAPASVTTYNTSFIPQYNGSHDGMSGCPMSVPVYQEFNASLSASSDLKPTIEHPSQADYQTSITVSNASGHPVTIPTNSSFYYKPVGGGQTTIASNSGGTYPSSPGGRETTTLSGNYNIPPGYQAGDEYCAYIHADYTSGYVGPGGAVLNPSGPADNSSCPRIANEPYFKVYNSDISAGGSFDNCTTEGGILAGYADISDPPGVTRGSTTQLSALALLKITGVASAKTSANIGGSPTKLTFANSDVQVDSSGNESPVLGGQYGGCRTLTNATAPPSASNYGGSTFNLAGKNGAYKHSGNITVNGATLAPGQNVSLFVDGDVYVASSSNYGNGWQAGTAPSFVLHASGNIYIAPGVTRLAGVYIAKNKIYTCADTANHFSPMPAAYLYNGRSGNNGCNNQLVVTGSFVAKQVNLMRTFGSLRDEEPNPGTPAIPGADGTSVLDGAVWSYGLPTPGMICTPTPETAEPASHTWYDNSICVPNTAAGRALRLTWTSNSGVSHTGPQSGSVQSAFNSKAEFDQLNAEGKCVQWSVPEDPHTWYDNYLCSTATGLSFSAENDPSQKCITIIERSDPDGQWSSGYYLCAPITGASAGTPASSPTPKGPPYTECSHKGIQTDSISCASELFQFSPTLYLSRPAIDPPGGGSIQFQSITSLPPVL